MLVGLFESNPDGYALQMSRGDYRWPSQVRFRILGHAKSSMGRQRQAHRRVFIGLSGCIAEAVPFVLEFWRLFLEKALHSH